MLLMEVAGEKAALRRTILAALSGMSPDSRERDSVQACARVLERPEWHRAHCILFYAPMPGELNVWPLLEAALRQGKTAGLPCFNPAAREYFARRVDQLDRDVLTGHFGIREPAATCPELPLNLLDLVLVPGVAFDQQGYRLGRGKGFYDRLLRNLRGTTCGVAYEQQMTPRVPLEPHDVRLNCILTPTRWISVPPPVLK
jgi:5-formyltetrahydrofolate cyclo-ligase